MTEEKRQTAFTNLQNAAREHGTHATSTEECPFKPDTAFYFAWTDGMDDAQKEREASA